MNPNRLSKVLVALRKYNPDHTGLILLLEEALKSGPGSEFFNRAFDNLIKSPGFRLPPEAGSPENFRDELTKTSTTTWMELQNQEQETKASAQLEQEIEKENEKKEEIKKEKRRVPRPSVPEEAKRLEKAVEKEVIKNMSDDRTNEAYQMSEKTIFDNWVKEQRKKGKEPSTIEECRKNEEFIEKVDDHFKKSQKDFKKNFEAEKRRVYKNPNDDPLIKEYKKILAEFRDRNQDEKNKRISIRGLRKVFKEYFSEKADGYDVRSEVKTTGEQAGSLPKAEVFEDVPIETIPHQPVSLKGSRISEIPKTSGEIPKVELKPISSAVRVPQAGEIASPTSVFRGMFGRVPFVGRFFGAGAGAGAGGAGAGAAAGATTAATTTAGTGAAAAVATSEIWIPILIAILIFLLLLP
ncbi:hypothetical protein M1307_00415, partial [Patescibacteria group bacterium]|nr:hypothetical protein [Patescibacteria group bacterium]